MTMSRNDQLRRNLEHEVYEPSTEGRLTIFTEPGVEDLPLPIRKAMAVKLMLETVPIHIYPGELIVGIGFLEHPVDGDKPRSIIPEDLSGGAYITSAHTRIATGLGKAPYDPVIRGQTGYMASSKWCVFPHYATKEEVEEARRMSLMENSNPGHLQAGNPRLIKYGWTGLKEMAENRMAGIDPFTSRGAKQTAFLRSVIIVLDALREFSLRYSRLAESMAMDETDPVRRSELLKISKVCRDITEKTPETFHEALQIHWLTLLANHTQGAHQSGRFDQYMWPPLKSDLEAGRLTEEEAQELLDNLWFKYASFTDVDADNLQNIILGGQTPEGVDATNTLTHICLDATQRLELIDPKVSVRIHRGTPDEVLMKTCEIIAGGVVHPGVYNDEAVIPAMVKSGIPLEDARDYTNDGCSEILVQGKTNPWAYEARVKLLTCLESVSERLEEYDSFDDVMAAVKDEITLAVTMATSTTNLIQAATPLISPNPLISATLGDCIEKALDLTEGGALYNTSAVCASGVADTADGLAAIKKLVYEEEAVGKGELVEALQNDFEGQERLRQMLLNRAPKFGNDEEYVDSIAAELVEHLHREVSRHGNPRGGKYILGIFSYGMYIGHGIVTGATPDGRKAGAFISPNFSPAPGRDRKGPFAVLKSTTRVDQMLTPNGTALDLTLHPSALRGPQGVEKLGAFLKSFIELGGIQVQFNVADAAVLREAQMEPEKHRNLTVRLWGFPAYFTRLPREFQDHIIARTEHAL